MNNNHSKLILTIFGIILASGALVFFLVLPLLSGAQGNLNKIASAESELGRLSREIERLELAVAELAKIREEKNRVGSIFPSRESMVSLVSGLESASDRAGTVISAFSLQDRKEEEFGQTRPARPEPSLIVGLSQIEEVPYTLSISGNYRDLVDYFLYFEHLPFMSEVKKLTITASSVQDEITRSLRNTGTGTGKIEGVLFIKSQ